MSRRTSFIYEVSRLAARPTAGRERGKERRRENRYVWDRADRFLATLGYRPRRVKEVSTHALFFYLQRDLAGGLTVRYVHNEASSFRSIMVKAGAKTAGMTPAILGLPARELRGRRKPMSEAEQREAFDRAQRLDPGLRLKLEAQLLLGLRTREALQGAADFGAWRDAMRAGATALHVTHGTKGARERMVTVLAARRTEILEFLEQAAAYCTANEGVLIKGKGGGLKSAIRRSQRLHERAGLTGENTSHTLRYAFAVALAEQLLDEGVEEFVVLVRVAASLGHGFTRLRFTLLTYLQSIEARFAKIFINGRLVGVNRFLRRVSVDSRTGEATVAPQDTLASRLTTIRATKPAGWRSSRDVTSESHRLALR